MPIATIQAGNSQAGTIFDYVITEENAYKIPISVSDGYEWNMPEHLRTTILYKNSQLESGKNKGKADEKPVRNIVRPILNLQHRTEGFDVKDVHIYVNDPQNYYKSFLIRKFHEQWAVQNDVDTFIDDVVESFVDFGGVLVKKTNTNRPEVVMLQSLAFCDQTDILSGPFAIKHFFSPDQLREMQSVGWGKSEYRATTTVKELITLSKNEKKLSKLNGKTVRTPGKYIEIYEVHGQFPESYLDESEDPEKYSQQLHIVAFYTGEDRQKKGLCLFAGKEKELPFKFLARDKIYGRALGFGGAEELFEPQVWVNYSEIRKKEMLDAAAKTILKTTDGTFASRNKVMDMENLEIAVLQEGTDISQIDTFPRNFALFDKSANSWEQHGQIMGAAGETSIQGADVPASGVPFASFQLANTEAHGLHEYRKGKLAIFLSEIYRDWIIPFIAKEITKGQEFLSELDLNELQWVADAVTTHETNQMLKERIFNGEEIYPEEIARFKDTARNDFTKGGNKKFITILAGELENAPLDVSIVISGKQKALTQVVDKLGNIFRQLVSSPGVLDDPRMAKILNQLLESSGLEPVDFYQKPSSSPMMAQGQPQQPQQMPPQMQQLAMQGK